MLKYSLYTAQQGTPPPPSLAKTTGHEAMKNNILIIMNCILFFILKPPILYGPMGARLGASRPMRGGDSQPGGITCRVKDLSLGP